MRGLDAWTAAPSTLRHPSYWPPRICRRKKTGPKAGFQSQKRITWLLEQQQPKRHQQQPKQPKRQPKQPKQQRQQQLAMLEQRLRQQQLEQQLGLLQEQQRCQQLG
jgi:hypothetical protein